MTLKPGDAEKIAALEKTFGLNYEALAAQKKVARLRAVLLELKPKGHFVLDDDCWYSCPASGECCNENAGTACDCGADALNAKIDAALKETE